MGEQRWDRGSSGKIYCLERENKGRPFGAAFEWRQSEEIQGRGLESGIFCRVIDHDGGRDGRGREE